MWLKCIAIVAITINNEAYQRLRKLKEPGDSFSVVILRRLPHSCDPAGEVLERLESIQVPLANPRLRAAPLSGRGAVPRANDLPNPLSQRAAS